MLKTNDYIVASEFTRVIGSPFEIVHNQDRNIALAETMIITAEPSNTTTGTSEAVEYDFFVNVPGVYSVSGLLIAPNGQSDSFFMAIDEENLQAWHTGTSSTFRKRTWKNVPLSEGKHTLRVVGRETGCMCSVWIIEDANGNLVTPSKFSVEPNGIVRANISEVGITNGLVAYYPLNKDAKDYSGNGYHGTVTGAVLTGGGFDGTGAYKFESGTTYINLPDDIGYQGQLTAMAWFKSRGSPGAGYHIIFGGPNLEISIPTSGQLRTGVVTTSRFVSNHGGGLLDGEWHQVAFTYENGVKVSFIDGAFVGNQTGISGSLSNIFSNRRIGVFGTQTSYFTNGDISNVKIFNRALTPEEIAVEYKRTGPTKMTQHNGTVYIQGQIKETI